MYTLVKVRKTQSQHPFIAACMTSAVGILCVLTLAVPAGDITDFPPPQVIHHSLYIDFDLQAQSLKLAQTTFIWCLF